MCEILIAARNNRASGVAQTKRGDILVVKEDGWVWGAQETRLYADGGMFVRLNLPGVGAAKAIKYTMPDEEITGIDYDHLGSPIVTTDYRGKHLWGLLIDNIPAGARAALLNTGEYTTTVAAIKSFLRNKVTGEEADFNG